MDKFIIKGELTSDKALTLTQDTTLSQCENVSTTLIITVPEQLADQLFQLEFGCPNGYNYITPMLDVKQQEQQYSLQYDIESCILQYSGSVTVQVAVRDKDDSNIVWKSNISPQSTLFVHNSVDGNLNTYAKQDFFAQAYDAIEKITTASQNIEDMTAQIEAVDQKCNSFLDEYQQKLQSGELRGQAGATVVSIKETGKDLDGNSIYTITMSDGGQFNFTVPAGKQGEKGDKGDTGLTGEYITTVFLKQTMPNGDKEYTIGTNMGNEFSFVSPKGDKGIDGEVITALNHTATDELGNRTYTFVTNMGKLFSFVSTKGDKGDKGDQGIQGIQGEKGDKGDPCDMTSTGTYPLLTAGKALADGNGNNIVSTYATKDELPTQSTIKQMLLNYCYPVGSIYQSTKNVSPASFLGGTWATFGAGRVLVGYNSSETEFNQGGKTGGSKTVTLTVDQMPAHQHKPHQWLVTWAKGGNTGIYDITTTTQPNGRINQIRQDDDTTRMSESTGGGSAHSNIQPYVVVYRWQRTA